VGQVTNVAPGSYTVSMTAGTGFTAVDCGGPGTPQTTTVTDGHVAVVNFYEKQIPAGQVQGASITQPMTGNDGLPLMMRAAAIVFFGIGLMLFAGLRKREEIGR